MDSKLDQTRDSYDRNAFQISEGFWQSDLGEMWDDFCQFLRSGAKVVDVGCGPGRDTALFTRRGYWTTGLDYSRGMLQEALQRAPAPYLQGDMRDLPFAANRFDGAWVCASLLHLPREESPRALSEVWRILKPGGIVFLALKEGRGERWDMRKGKRFFTFFQEEEIRNLLASAGFEIVRVSKNSGETADWLNIFAQKS